MHRRCEPTPDVFNLVTMRATDIDLVHMVPGTAFDYSCHICLERVGVGLAGQHLLRKFGHDKVRITCNRCITDAELSNAEPASGALEEAFGSIDEAFKDFKDE